MQRIDGPTVAHALPAPSATGTGPAAPGYFTDGNPATATPPTTVTGDWANAVQEELIAVIAAGGLTPAKAALTQVRDAIAQMIANAAPAAPDLSGKVDKSTTISAGGIATGGGDLSESRTITVPKASGAEVQAGTNDTKAITPAALAAGYQGAIANPGWMRHPNGLIEQWGDGLTPAAGGLAVTFPVPFPNGVLNVLVSTGGNGSPPTAFACSNNLTLTGMLITVARTAGVDAGAGIGVLWHAWGH